MRVLHDNREITLGQTKVFTFEKKSGQLTIMRVTIVGLNSTGFIVKQDVGVERAIGHDAICWTLDEMVKFVRIQNKDWIPNE